MPLLLLDLDNTLLDRDGPFRAWGERFLDGIGAPRADLDWLVSVDADGLTNRWDVADAIRDRYALRIPSIDLVDELHDGVVAHMRLDPLVACALRIAADAGWCRWWSPTARPVNRTPRSARPAWTGTSPTG